MRQIAVLSIAAVLWVATTPAAAEEPAPRRTFATMIEALKPTELITYKQIDGRALRLHLFRPEATDARGLLPAYVVIHGGGWRSNNAQRFYPYANSLVEHGFVGISVDYRLVNQDKGVTVFDCVKDARSAVRYIRKHAKDLGIDPDRIAVGGGSAGAHLALGTALFDGIDHVDEDRSVSCRPDALVLLFGVLDTSKEGYGNALIGKDWQTLSPLHQIRKGMPPTILFHGDKDTVAPYPVLEKFCDKLKENKVTYELVLEKGGVHGHINNDMKLFDDAARRTLKFLNEKAFVKAQDAEKATDQ